jgi:hypothetical protein
LVVLTAVAHRTGRVPLAVWLAVEVAPLAAAGHPVEAAVGCPVEVAAVAVVGHRVEPAQAEIRLAR